MQLTNYQEFLSMLEEGALRAATLSLNNKWIVNTEVKKNILEIFKNSESILMRNEDNESHFIDKALLRIRKFSIEDTVRIPEGGSSVRAGAFIGKNVVIMPPSYINIGAYIGNNSMIDSHVLVGSCAQIGANVHLSASVQIGGVLEPIGSIPVIIEDDCFIGAGVILTEGILIRKGAVIAPGVALSASVPIYDICNNEIYEGEIPERAIVVQGNRSIASKGDFSKKHGLSINCAVIIKYRDDKTNAATALEMNLR
ncbi:MAG: 2,3,4,5-tetrahydropyridine-2,6-dicarboxylate N-succinyltransferase [Proteobacteria bacterium]|nr:2,3,4,5-tetrahydropyridine-2,6-dicarboxylate N-succinyltransferase [Pseudomonadota bacterium]